jgi:hypothetical protein
MRTIVNTEEVPTESQRLLDERAISVIVAGGTVALTSGVSVQVGTIIATVSTGSIFVNEFGATTFNTGTLNADTINVVIDDAALAKEATLSGMYNSQGTLAQEATLSGMYNSQGTLAQEATLSGMYNSQGTLARETTLAGVSSSLTAIMNQQGTLLPNFGTVVLANKHGEPIETHVDIDGEPYLGIAAIQAVHTSDKNSYNGILNAGAVYYGTAESTLGVVGIQTMLKSDQNCLVTVQQSGNNGVDWDIVDTYVYYHHASGTTRGESWTTQAVGGSYRVNVQNTGTAATEFTRLYTFLAPIINPYPRALSSNGNVRVSVEELPSTFGVHGKVTPMGDLRTADTVRLVGADFSDSSILDTNFWGSLAVGTGTIVPGNNQVVLRTGVVTGSTVSLTSIRSARYVAGMSNHYRSHARVAQSVAPVTQRWGAFTATTGFFFEYNGSSLSLVCRKNGSDANRISNGNFNAEIGDSLTLDSNSHAYEIYWTNRSVWFIIDDTIIHEFVGATAPLVNTSTLPVRAENNNGANTNDNLLEIRAASIQRHGPLHTESTYKTISAATATVCKYTAGRLNRVVICNPNAAAQTVAIYDNVVAMAPIIGTLVIPATPVQAVTMPFTIDYNCPFHSGLTVVTSTANPVTFIYE